MDAGRVIKELSSGAFPIALTLCFGTVLALGFFKGAPVHVYFFSYVIGCLPWIAFGFFRPLSFFNPYVNLWTGRDKSSLTEKERASLEILKGPKGKRAMLSSTFMMGFYFIVLYLVTNYVVPPIGVHRFNSYEAIFAGSFFTFVQTLSYTGFFYARIMAAQQIQSDKQVF